MSLELLGQTVNEVTRELEAIEAAIREVRRDEPGFSKFALTCFTRLRSDLKDLGEIAKGLQQATRTPERLLADQWRALGRVRDRAIAQGRHYLQSLQAPANHVPDVWHLLGELHQSHPLTRDVPFAVHYGDLHVDHGPGFAPIYFIPGWYERQDRYRALLLHEFGHVLLALIERERPAALEGVQIAVAPLARTNHMRCPVLPTTTGEQPHIAAATWERSCAVELFCDSLGLALGGPPFAKAFLRHFAPALYGVTHDQSSDRPPDLIHPPSGIRTEMLAQLSAVWDWRDKTVPWPKRDVRSAELEIRSVRDALVDAIGASGILRSNLQEAPLKRLPAALTALAKTAGHRDSQTIDSLRRTCAETLRSSLGRV